MADQDAHNNVGNNLNTPSIHRFTITPSSFANYFYFNCDRQLGFSAGHLDRVKWFYKDPITQEWKRYQSSTCIELELAFLTGKTFVTLTDGVEVDIPKRQQLKPDAVPIMRALWYKRIKNSSEYTYIPIPEVVSTQLETALHQNKERVDVVLDGTEWSADLTAESKCLRAGEKIIEIVRGQRDILETGNDSVGAAFIESGNKWEEILLGILKEQGHVVHTGSNSDNQRSKHKRAADIKLSYQEFQTLLRTVATDVPSTQHDNRTRYFVYQPTLVAPKTLYEKLNIDPSRFAFSTCYPDFLEIVPRTDPSGKVVLREIIIIDAKATDKVKLSHRIQVGIYALILKELLRDLELANQPPIKISSQGAVWLRGEKEYKLFHLAPVKKFLKGFLSGERGKFSELSSNLEYAEWHLNRRCQFCSFYNFCKDQASKNGKKDFSLIYKLSKTEKQYLSDFLQLETGRKVTDIEEAHTLLQRYNKQQATYQQLIDDSRPVDAIIEQLHELKLRDDDIDYSAVDVDKLANQLASVSISNEDTTAAVDESQSSVTADESQYESTNTAAEFTTPKKAPVSATSTPLAPVSPGFVAPSPTSKGIPPPSPFVEDKSKKLVSELLPRDLWLIKLKVDAFHLGEVITLPRASIELPTAEDLAVIITVQLDRPNGHIFSWGIFVVAQKDTIRQRIKKDLMVVLSNSEKLHLNLLANDSLFISSAINEALPAEDPKVTALEALFVQTLYECCCFAAERLAKNDTTSFFVYNNSEYSTIENILSRVLHSKLQQFVPLRTKAGALLNTFFVSPESIFRETQPSLENASPHPLIIVKKVLDKHLVLPLLYDADLSDIHKVLVKRNKVSTTLGENIAHSNARNILAGWYTSLKERNKQSSKLESKFDLLKSLVDRLQATYEIIIGVRTSMLIASELMLPIKPRTFSFKPTVNLYHPTLARLTYLSQYEVWQSAMKKMESRASILSAYFGNGELLEDRVAVLVYKGQVSTFTPVKRQPKLVHLFKYETLSEVIRSDMQLQKEKKQSFKCWMITPAAEGSILAALQFNDFSRRIRPNDKSTFFPPKTLVFASYWGINETKRELLLEVSSNCNLNKGDVCYLTPIELDLLGDEAQSVLRRIDLLNQFKAVLAEVENADFLTWLASSCIARIDESTPLPIPETENGAILESIHEKLGLTRAATRGTPKKSPKKTAAVSSTADPASRELIPENNDVLVWECLALAAMELLHEVPTLNTPITFLNDLVTWGIQHPGGNEASDTAATIRVRELANLAASVIDQESNLTFITPHQRDVFEHVITHRLTCLWGPPGSGKTYFLGASVALLCEAHRQKPKENEFPESTDIVMPEGGTPFRVLVTAFTHAAIDNVVRYIMKQNARMRKVLADSKQVTQYPLAIARLVNKGKADTTLFDEVDDNNESTPKKKTRRRPIFPEVGLQACYAENPSEIKDFINKNAQCVVAGTVWAIKKVFKQPDELTRFHLIIIDEASQMLLGQALIPLRFLCAEQGRVIIAGDHHQLPPIINAEYPDVPPGQAMLWGSVFDYVQTVDVYKRCTRMLCQNWRMNEILTKLPAKVIYKSDRENEHYYPATADIASRKFVLTCAPGDPYKLQDKTGEITFPVHTPLLKLVLDGEKQMVVILLKSEKAFNKDPFPQAKLIACFANAIRRVIQTVFPGRSDRKFWDENLLIVAPHHVQRQLIRERMLEESSWRYAWDIDVLPSIETVEKAQGREFDFVVVDYGIIDPFRISREMRFLYNRNRLNVAQSRARCKCVMFLSESLLNLQSEVFFTTRMQEGYTYMLKIADYARQLGTLVELDVDDIPNLVSQLSEDPFFEETRINVRVPSAAFTTITE